MMGLEWIYAVVQISSGALVHDGQMMLWELQEAEEVP